jgi:hypothetical protein
VIELIEIEQKPECAVAEAMPSRMKPAMHHRAGVE